MESQYKPAAENIIDSRITEKRPVANITIEKRKLLNNNLVKGEDVDLNAESLDKLAKASPPVLPPPFSLFKKDAPLKTGMLSSPKIGWPGGEKSTDESSDANNYNSAFSQKSLTRQGNASQVGPVTSKRTSAQTQISQILKKSTSALKRRLEDQNHLQTIESEEIQATDGTIIDNQTRLATLNNQQQAQVQGKLDSVQVYDIMQRQPQKQDLSQPTQKSTSEANTAYAAENPYQKEG